jgi:hypothetical protein
MRFRTRILTPKPLRGQDKFNSEGKTGDNKHKSRAGNEEFISK